MIKTDGFHLMKLIYIVFSIMGMVDYRGFKKQEYKLNEYLDVIEWKMTKERGDAGL